MGILRDIGAELGHSLGKMFSEFKSAVNNGATEKEGDKEKTDKLEE